MTCQEFLVRHAEYMDDLLTSPEAARWQAHASSCNSCAHYDRVVRQGVSLLRALPEVEPSSDFFPRLQHRLYNLEDGIGDGARGPGGSVMVSLAIAGVQALLAWSPLLRLDQGLLPVVGTGDGWVAGEAGNTMAADREVTEPAPSSIRPIEPVGSIWTGSYQIDRRQATGWVATDLIGESAPTFELVPHSQWPVPAGEVWWWSGAGFQAQGLRSYTPTLNQRPGAALAPQLPATYSPLLTGGTRTTNAAGAELVRTAGDTVLPYN
jgi:hypothetical protein